MGVYNGDWNFCAKNGSPGNYRRIPLCPNIVFERLGHEKWCKTIKFMPKLVCMGKKSRFPNL